MSKSVLKKSIRKAMLQTGLYKNIKVWDITYDTDYMGKTWINVEISAEKRPKNKKL